MTFVDARTNAPFIRSNVPASQLPETFALETTMHVGDQDYRVLRAAPETKAEFVRTGRLTLETVNVEVQSVDLHAVWHTLPTIHGTLPELDATADGSHALQMHEDDWRQVELVSIEHRNIIVRHIEEVREVLASASSFTDAERKKIASIADAMGKARGVGRYGRMERIVLRDDLTEPLGSISLSVDDIADARVFGTRLDGVRFRSAGGLVRGSYAFASRSGVGIYGLCSGDRIRVVGLHGPPPSPDSGEFDWIEAIGARGLVLVDWCSGVAVDLRSRASIV